MGNIPFLLSSATLKAPEELRKPRKHDREHNELDRAELDAVRQKKKVRRRKNLDRKLQSGALTLGGLRERKQALEDKNQWLRKNVLRKAGSRSHGRSVFAPLNCSHKQQKLQLVESHEKNKCVMNGTSALLGHHPQRN